MGGQTTMRVEQKQCHDEWNQRPTREESSDDYMLKCLF